MLTTTLLYYIVSLHQTTTPNNEKKIRYCCIISSLYIKPQQISHSCLPPLCCIISSLYIKPQPSVKDLVLFLVVLYRLSTSNHNLGYGYPVKASLYYIVSLHQNTTLPRSYPPMVSCIISSLYIKPQLSGSKPLSRAVVLYRLSTSNHNSDEPRETIIKLYYIVSLHQTTTQFLVNTNDVKLYYIVSLHQTTTRCEVRCYSVCCIISSLYIKPQPRNAFFVSRSRCIISSLYIKPQQITIVFILF